MTPRKSKIVCECLGVTESQLVAAIHTHELCTLKQVTACTDAGGGCTVCHPAIREYLAREARAKAAEDDSEAAGPPYSSSSPSLSVR
jgi:NAD(P)H-nitrite reductase large subunit